MQACSFYECLFPIAISLTPIWGVRGPHRLCTYTRSCTLEYDELNHSALVVWTSITATCLAWPFGWRVPWEQALSSQCLPVAASFASGACFSHNWSHVFREPTGDSMKLGGQEKNAAKRTRHMWLFCEMFVRDWFERWLQGLGEGLVIRSADTVCGELVVKVHHHAAEAWKGDFSELHGARDQCQNTSLPVLPRP